MKQRIVTLLLILLTAVNLVMAQEDPVAEKYLDALSKKTKSIEPFKITYTLTTVNLQDSSENSYEGTLVYGNNKYRLTSGETEIFFDGKTIWNYLSDVNEVNITSPDPDDHSFLADPGQLFSGYKKRFKYHFIDKQDVDGTSILIIDLYPVNLNEDYSRIRLQVAEKDMQLYAAHYFGKGGTHYLIKIHTTAPRIKVSDKYFQFDPKEHPDVEVIDLRDP